MQRPDSSLPPSGSQALRVSNDVVLARRIVRTLAQQAGLSLLDQTKIVTAASELARNTVTHGGGGILVWQLLAEDSKRGVRLTFRDQGPGIKNVALALRDGWTSARGLGLGLPGARRLTDEFELVSSVGVGTQVTVTKWYRRSYSRSGRRTNIALHTDPKS